MSLDNPSQQPPHLTPGNYLITIISVTVTATVIYLVATWIGFSESASARAVGFLYVFYIVALSFPFVLAWLPRSARSWLARVVQVAPSWETYDRLRVASETCAGDAPDFSRFAAPVHQRDKLPAWFAVILAIVIPTTLLLVPGVSLVVAIAVGSGAFAAFTRSSRKWSELRQYSLELADKQLLQKDSSGVIIARIDLGEPFTYEYLDKATGSAIYQLRQRDQRLEFTSEDPLAKHVVPDLLHLDWPPIDRLTF